MNRSAATLDLLRTALSQLLEGIDKIRTDEDWVSQTESPLGKRAHLRAVRSGELVGHKVGQVVLVRRADLDAYIQKHGSRAKAPANDELTEEEAIKRAAEYVAPQRRSRNRSA